MMTRRNIYKRLDLARVEETLDTLIASYTVGPLVLGLGEVIHAFCFSCLYRFSSLFVPPKSVVLNLNNVQLDHDLSA